MKRPTLVAHGSELSLNRTLVGPLSDRSSCQSAERFNNAPECIRTFSGEDGETLATFDDPEDVFTDPTAYPATETDISDFSEWTAIKRPALPSRIDRDVVDVIAVTDTGLHLIEAGEQIPIDQLIEGDDDQAETCLPVDQLRRR